MLTIICIYIKNIEVKILSLLTNKLVAGFIVIAITAGAFQHMRYKALKIESETNKAAYESAVESVSAYAQNITSLTAQYQKARDIAFNETAKVEGHDLEEIIKKHPSMLPA